MILNATQAAAMFGRHHDTITDACKAGRLPARRVDGQWEIDVADLESWSRRTKRQPIVPWTEADVAALVELHASDGCTREQMAVYLGRSFMSIRIKLTALRKTGQLAHHGAKNKTPWRVPATGILLARTCKQCGKLRDATCYGKHVAGNIITTCILCTRNNVRGNKSASIAVRERLNAVTREQAVNEGKRYTDDELEQLRDSDTDDLTLAFRMGRSLFGVWNKRQKMGVKPARAKWRKVSNDAWQIAFPDPAAVEATIERFQELGKTAPEAIYGVWEHWYDITEGVA